MRDSSAHYQKLRERKKRVEKFETKLRETLRGLFAESGMILEIVEIDYVRVVDGCTHTFMESFEGYAHYDEWKREQLEEKQKMKTYKVSNHEPGTLTIKKIATVEADYFEIGPNGDLLFYSLVRLDLGSSVPFAHNAFASGQWTRVEEVKGKDK